jgi:hypothetical protein
VDEILDTYFTIANMRTHLIASEVSTAVAHRRTRSVRRLCMAWLCIAGRARRDAAQCNRQ